MRLYGLRDQREVASTSPPHGMPDIPISTTPISTAKAIAKRRFGDWPATSPRSGRTACSTPSRASVLRIPPGLLGDPFRYDFSADYILAQVEGSLARLGVDTVDLLLLHRPDYLFHPDEVATAFAHLLRQGKVRQFESVTSTLPGRAAGCRSPHASGQPSGATNLHHIASLDDGTLDQCLQRGTSPSMGVRWAQSLTPPGATHSAWSTSPHPGRTSTAGRALYRQPHANRTGLDPQRAGRVLLNIGSTRPERIREATTAAQIDYRREDWVHCLAEARSTTTASMPLPQALRHAYACQPGQDRPSSARNREICVKNGPNLANACAAAAASVS